jgi:hypothetical protein
MATDTSATNVDDLYIAANYADTNYGAETTILIGNPDGAYRALFKWTLPAGSSSITAIKLYIKGLSSGTTRPNIEVHELTRTTWTESGATWNTYDGANSWTSAGGDFSSTVVDDATPASATAWTAFDLGAGATNPISGLTWGSTVHLLLKATDESTLPGKYIEILSKEHATAGSRPYIEITYTVPATGMVSAILLW